MASIYQDLRERLSAGNPVVLVSQLARQWRAIFPPLVPTVLDSALEALARQALSTRCLQYVPAEQGGPLLLEPFFPSSRLVVLGGGHVALPLVAGAARLGWSVTVIDDRPQFANQTRFSTAQQIICAEFGQAIRQLEFTPNTYVVIATRGHQHDLTCLRGLYGQAPQAAYFGLLTSRRRLAGVKEQLLAEGIAAEWLEGLSAPVGLAIGAVTPEEIAISILAEMIALKRLGTTDRCDWAKQQKQLWPEFDTSLLQELAHPQQDALALVTIIAAKGSVPCRAGTKMLVWPDGRTLGSIGGGCSEAAAITAARDVLCSGGYLVQHLDMTGPVTDSDGMVCGGSLDVLIERIER